LWIFGPQATLEPPRSEMAPKKRSNGNSDSLEDRKRKKRDEAPEALQKVKEEPKEKQGEGQEGLKNEEEKKEEAKEEAKQEVKEELADVKEEENEEDSQLNALLGDAPVEEALTERGLRRQQREEAAFQVTVDTDTEYDEPALEPFPQAVVIEGCSYEKLNGEYRIMPKPSRGRPSYCKPSSSKSMYLYCIPGKRWCIGFEFGSKKCIASVPDIGSLEPPVDPYPFHWKVVDRNAEGGAKKDKHEKRLCVEMRAFSDEVKELMKSFFMEEMYPPLEFDAKHLYEDSDDDANLTIPPEETPEETPEPETKAKAASSKLPAASKPEMSKSKKQRKTRSSPKKAPAFTPPADDEEAAMVMMAGQQSDSDDESKATAKAASSQPSDSDDSSVPDDSDGSSSSESSEQEDADFQALPVGSKARSIVNRLKTMAVEQAAEKCTKLFDIIRSKSKNGTLVPLAGCTESDMRHVAQWAMRHLHVEDLWRAGTTPAPANGPRTPQELPQPHTPPVDEERPRVDATAQLPHHTMAAPKSVLKKPGDRGPARRIRHNDQRHEVPVVSYKSCGEGLWYQAPGSYVSCDYCNRMVPQALGSLQGAQGRSQFAQNLFLCQDCSAGRT